MTANNPYYTDFKTAENPLSLGGKWTNGRDVGLKWNNVQAVSGIACGADFVGLGASRYDDCIAHLDTAFGPDQYAQGTVFRAPGYKNRGM